MSDAAVVLDASALLALLHDEPGAEAVARVLSRCVISAVNLSEVVAKLTDHGMPLADIRTVLNGLPLDVRPFDQEAAYASGSLRGVTRGNGLSFGDRTCLALANQLSVEAITADRAWARLPDGTARVTVIR